MAVFINRMQAEKAAQAKANAGGSPVYLFKTVEFDWIVSATAPKTYKARIFYPSDRNVRGSQTTWRALSVADQRRIRCQGGYRKNGTCCTNSFASQCRTVAMWNAGLAFYYHCTTCANTFKDEETLAQRDVADGGIHRII